MSGHHSISVAVEPPTRDDGFRFGGGERASCSCGWFSDAYAMRGDLERAIRVHLRRSERIDLDALLARSSVGAALLDVEERGVSAHLADLEEETEGDDAGSVHVVRALTMTQPWASLVACGIKTVEGRSQKIIKREDFGKPIAVHASRTIDEGVYARVDQIWPPGAPDPSGGRPRWYQLSRVTSAVIGAVTIQRAVARDGDRIVDAHDGSVVDLGDAARWFLPEKRIGYVLRDAIVFREAIACRGHRCLWSLTKGDRRLFSDQIASIARDD